MLAMKEMNLKIWSQCCDQASKELSEMGLVKNISGKTIQNWAAEFRKEHVFPHPGRHTAVKKTHVSEQTSHRIFEYFPRAKEIFLEIVNENHECLTAKLMHEEVPSKLLPILERESTENGCFDDGSPGQKMLNRFLANPPSQEMVRKWMTHLNVEYDKFCTRKGRNGNSYLSQRMKEAWASGKYSNRRPKGQGLKKGKSVNEEEDEGHIEDTSV